MPRIISLIVWSLLYVSTLPAQNPFRTACDGNLARLDSLLTADNSLLYQSDQRQRSLLHWAVACEQRAVVDYLLAKGSDLDAEDDQGKTPMHMAVRFGRSTYFELLRQAQPNPSWTKRYGVSLLQEAIFQRDTTFLAMLVAEGVNVNGTNERGTTPLELSQRLGEPVLVDFLLRHGADPDRVRSFSAAGPYFGQAPPDTTPVVFAPNFISTEEYEFGSVFNAAGDEFYFGVDVGRRSEIRYTQLGADGRWSTPIVLLEHEDYGYNDPFLSPDEQRLYFITQRPLDGVGPPKEDHDIWYVEKTMNGWSAPINAGLNINTEGNEYYISFTQSGTMYFASSRKDNNLDIYAAPFANGEFQAATALPPTINTSAYEADVFVDPQEAYLIFCSTRSGGLGRGDLYVSFKSADGSWTEAVNLSTPINTQHHELCPFVSADGKYLFYTSDEDIYWVSTERINALRPAKK